MKNGREKEIEHVNPTAISTTTTETGESVASKRIQSRSTRVNCTWKCHSLSCILPPPPCGSGHPPF